MLDQSIKTNLHLNLIVKPKPTQAYREMIDELLAENKTTGSIPTLEAIPRPIPD